MKGFRVSTFALLLVAAGLALTAPHGVSGELFPERASADRSGDALGSSVRQALSAAHAAPDARRPFVAASHYAEPCCFALPTIPPAAGELARAAAAVPAFASVSLCPPPERGPPLVG